VSNFHNRENKMNMDDNNTTTRTATGPCIIRTGGTATTLLTPVIISTPYVHPPNTKKAITPLKGTKLESFCALLAPLTERFITAIFTQYRAALDLSLKIK